jgi:hypothetical protein
LQPRANDLGLLMDTPFEHRNPHNHCENDGGHKHQYPERLVQRPPERLLEK